MDVNGQSVINYVALNDDLVVYLVSVCTDFLLPHDTLYLAGDIRRVMSKYDFISFLAVVTDNTAANRLV
ncbi:hypothetical protein PPTG_00724 [Phytophthora nicotianae INRA-310]|uniref:Uncharacterized protein n=1 Tax=Phytophthora nicotianae (strain INRA-310) TaxID=761204 RepID=W2RG12_PHYN3|nr:hypothetical protein PPTG_00724 [Phytophthora nicotianae INRA-310]ETN24358.1 hypothetical protein PPTG_00724 [Phytophthora nicotianae INRA-310]